jgi:anti-anti-sigma regulatory factor
MNKRIQNGVFVVAFDKPRITLAGGSYMLERTLHEAILDGQLAVAIDFLGVEFLDTSTLTILSRTYCELLTRHGHLCLFHVRPQLQELFDQLYISDFIDIQKFEEDAVEQFNGRPKRRYRGGKLWRTFNRAYSAAFNRKVLPDRRRDGARIIHGGHERGQNSPVAAV